MKLAVKTYKVIYTSHSISNLVFQTYFGFFLCICLLLVATARMKYFSINEESANVHDITEMVRSSFEDQTLILVQSNGCRLEDTEKTRGISCA